MNMAQLFSKSADTYLRALLLSGLLALVGLCVVASQQCEPGYITRVGWAPEQPVPFSHAHHVGGLGLDCRYCHGSVETTPSAGFPPTHTCMTCHSQVWTQAETLAPVRRSYAQNQPLRWTRVYDLPEFVHFRHDIHIFAGVGCEACHGRVDQMPLTRQATALKMKWCLDCHRDPAPHLRPRQHLFDMGWQPPEAPDERAALGEELMKKHAIETDILTNCSTCHY